MVVYASFDRMIRIGNAAKELATNPTSDSILFMYKDGIVQSVDQFVLSDEEVRVAIARADRGTLNYLATEKLYVPVYDRIRIVLVDKLPEEVIGSAASTIKTADDLVSAGEVIVKVLRRHESKAWVPSLVEPHNGLHARLKTDLAEMKQAAFEQQSAEGKRREAAEVLSAELVPFRRIVGNVYGKTSIQYHSLEVPKPRKRKAKGESAETAKTEKPAEAAKSEKPAETAKTEKPAEAAKTEKPAEAAKTEKPAETAKTEKTAEATTVANTDKPSESAKTDNNGKAA